MSCCKECTCETKITFDQYQHMVAVTSTYPNVGDNFVYPALGLCGEAGEVAEKIKKVLRDNNGVIETEAKRQEILKEISDVLWYCAAMAAELQSSLQEVAQINYDKLMSRKERGVLHGSGDNR